MVRYTCVWIYKQKARRVTAGATRQPKKIGEKLLGRQTGAGSTCTYAYKYTCTYVCMYNINVCVCMCVCKRARTHTFINTHIHMYMYTYMHMRARALGGHSQRSYQRPRRPIRQVARRQAAVQQSLFRNLQPRSLALGPALRRCRPPLTSLYIYIHKHTCYISICMYMYVHVCTCMYTHIHTYIHTCMLDGPHICVCIHTHTHTRTRTHTHTQEACRIYTGASRQILCQSLLQGNRLGFRV